MASGLTRTEIPACRGLQRFMSWSVAVRALKLLVRAWLAHRTGRSCHRCGPSRGRQRRFLASGTSTPGTLRRAVALLRMRLDRTGFRFWRVQATSCARPEPCRPRRALPESPRPASGGRCGSLPWADNIIGFSNVKYLKKRLPFVWSVSFGVITLRLEPLGPDLNVFSVREDRRIFVGSGKSQCACRVGSQQASPHGNPRERIDVDNA